MVIPDVSLVMINDLAYEISYLCHEGMREIGEGSMNCMGGVKSG